MKKTAKRLARLAAGAAAGAAALALAQAANAGAIAFSTLEVSNFRIFNGAGVQYATGAFDVLEVSNFTKAEAMLDGSGLVSTHPSDVPLRCVGTCAGIAQNDFSQQGGPLGHFSRADAVMSGAAVSGLNGADSVSARSVAEVQLNANGEGTAGSNVGSGSRLSFALANDDVLDFRFDAQPFLRAMLEDQDVMSFAGVAWSVTVRDASNNLVFGWAPNGVTGGVFGGTEISDPFSVNTSVSVLAPGDVVYDPGAGSFRAVTGVLSAGQTYTLAINEESSANALLVVDAQPVVEPATAALLGLGLLGLAGGRRRVPTT
jgi:hypothetical protein